MPAAPSFPIRGSRVWVTGGGGFLGRAVTEELSGRGAEVLAPARATCDLLDPGSAHDYLQSHRPDAVVHLAARVGGIGANRMHPGSFFFANMSMGLNVVEACRKVGVGKLLVLGTVCGYPKHCPVPFREDDFWLGYPEETNAHYGIAKKALLVMLQAYRQEYGLRGIYLVPVNLYGPGDHLDPERSHVIPALIRKFIEAKAEGKPQVELWGTGKITREFLYVEDAARGICDALASYEDPDPVNLGTGVEISIHDLALKIGSLVGYGGGLAFNPAYPDGQPRRCLDVSRARERFGWRAQVGLDEGLLRTFLWASKELGAS